MRQTRRSLSDIVRKTIGYVPFRLAALGVEQAGIEQFGLEDRPNVNLDFPGGGAPDRGSNSRMLASLVNRNNPISPKYRQPYCWFVRPDVNVDSPTFPRRFCSTFVGG